MPNYDNLIKELRCNAEQNDKVYELYGIKRKRSSERDASAAIESLQSENARLEAEIAELKRNDNPDIKYSMTHGITLDRLEEICAAEKDGKLVMLPCNIGETVYFENFYMDKKIVSAIVSMIVIENEETFFYARWDGFSKKFSICDIGKSVFLAKESVEQALKEHRCSGTT